LQFILYNHNCKLEISTTASTKAKSRKRAYSQANNQNKIDRQMVKIERVTQADKRTAMVDDVNKECLFATQRCKWSHKHNL